jgi:Mg/Co/Ni transporter MgtE
MNGEKDFINKSVIEAERNAKFVSDQTVDDVYNIAVGEPASVKSGDVLKNAVDAIINHPVSQKVYVVDNTGKLIGTVSIDSLLRQVGNRIGARKSGITSFINLLTEVAHEEVEKFMVKPVSVKKDTELRHALKLMLENNLTDLPVVDEDNKLIGELNGLEIIIAARKLFKEKDETSDTAHH